VTAVVASRPRVVVDRLTICTRAEDAVVVDRVSFTVEPGETVGLVGESGSGKTTVALALLGYTRPGVRIIGGSVRVGDHEITAMSERELQRIRGAAIAYVPQDPTSALNPALTVGTQLREVLRAAKLSREAASLRLEEVLTDVGLDMRRVLASYPHQLSGGQQQRVVVAMAFLLRPAVIVLDEPTTGLDVSTQRRVLATIQTMCASHHVSGVFISHDLAVIDTLVDTVAVMYAGELVELGPTRAVFDRPAHPYTRALLRAVPSAERSHVLIGLPGQPPRPAARPHGCLFAPRCDSVLEACRVARPPAHALDEARIVRCIRASELATRFMPAAALASSQAVSQAGGEVLRVEGLSASFGVTSVLHNVTLGVHDRECLAIVGESGSGKTTLARCIVGLHHRHSGSIKLDGKILPRQARSRTPEALLSLQYIFQNPYSSLNPRRTVQQILEQPLRRFFDLGRTDRRMRIAAALESAALTASFARRYPGELSGGERQRVAIARALVVDPKVLICDEITSALDVSVQATIVDTLARLQEERRLAMVFITHNLALVRSVAQRVVVLQHGVVVESAATDEIFARPTREYTRQLLEDLPHMTVPASG
jgi:peptide/nickel transport system ATP-binding protein